jgi:hypothetical protein
MGKGSAGDWRDLRRRRATRRRVRCMVSMVSAGWVVQVVLGARMGEKKQGRRCFRLVNVSQSEETQTSDTVL